MCVTEFQHYSTVQWSALVHAMQHASDNVHARRVPAPLRGCHLLQLPLLRCTFLPAKASDKVDRHKRRYMLMSIWKVNILSHLLLCPRQTSLLALWSFADLCFAFRLAFNFSLALQSLSPIMHDWPWQPSANHSVHLWGLI